MTPSTTSHDEWNDALDDVYDALCHRTRRRTLLALAERQPCDVAEMASNPADPDRSEREVRIELHHHHLPALADGGFVDWTPGTETVERGPRFDDVRPHLDLLRERDGEAREMA